MNIIFLVPRIVGALQKPRPLQRRKFGGSGHWNRYGLTFHRDGHKVAVIGAGGGVGQTLSLLLKASNKVGDLALYDNCGGVAGIVEDLVGVYNLTTVSSHEGKKGIEDALHDASIVLVTAGVPRYAAEMPESRTTDVSFSVRVLIPFSFMHVQSINQPTLLRCAASLI